MTTYKTTITSYTVQLLACHSLCFAHASVYILILLANIAHCLGHGGIEQFPWFFMKNTTTENMCVHYADYDVDLILSFLRRKNFIWTSVGLLSIRPLGTYFWEISIKIQQFSQNKTHLKMSAAKLGSFCLGFSVLMFMLANIQHIGARDKMVNVFQRTIEIHSAWKLLYTSEQVSNH